MDKCGNGYDGWHWREDANISVAAMKQMLIDTEFSMAASFPVVARVIPYLAKPDVGNCFPNCDELINLPLPSTSPSPST